LVQSVYVEEWVMEQLPPTLAKMKHSEVRVWPSSKSVASLDEKDLLISLDYIITIGGDGTLLLLLKNIGEYEQHHYLPPIITFSQGSLNYLGNFEVKEYEKILDAVIVKGSAYETIVYDHRMRL
jgi:NAD kinase